MNNEKVNEYINKMVGVPWVLGGNCPIDDNGLDCWGTVTHSFKELDNIDLPNIENRQPKHMDETGGIQLDSGKYTKLSLPENGCIFLCYKNNALVHVGRVLANKAYHCNGNIGIDGSVVVWPLKKLLCVYDSVKYVRYNANN